MNILFIGPLPEPTTGQSLACRVLLTELQKHGDVEVINLSKSDFRQGVSSIRRIFEVVDIIWRVWRGCRRSNLIYFTPAESIAGNIKDCLIYLVCYPSLSSVYIHLHGGAGMRQLLSNRHPLLKVINTFFLTRIGGVIVLGRRHLSIYEEIVDRKKIHIVPNFSSDDLFVSEESVAKKFGNFDKINVLFLSNLLPGKGYKELLLAIKQLSCSARQRFSFDFAGGFESALDAEDFMECISDIPEVMYHGVVTGESKARLFAAAHIFCLPTYYPYEGQPISILEAYASGCAVITTDHSGIFDIFDDGVSGIAVQKQSAGSIAAALMRLQDEPQLARDMALRNLEKAGQLYRAQTFNRNLLSVLRIGPGATEAVSVRPDLHDL